MQKYLALAACLVMSFPAFAQTVEQDGPLDRYSTATERSQGTFLAYHMAIRAEERCKGRSFTPGDQYALEKVTADQMFTDTPQIAMGAGRLLTLIRKADDDMDHLVSREGCDGQKVKESLQLYDDKLASVHGNDEPAAPQATEASTETSSTGQTTVVEQAPGAPGVTTAPVSQQPVAAQAPVKIVPELLPSSDPQPLTP